MALKYRMKLHLSLFLLLTLSCLISCGKGVELDNKNWSYSNGKCKVTFTLKNNSYNDEYRKVKIVVQRQKNIGKGALVNDVLGERTLTLELKAQEKIELTEVIPLFPDHRPSMVLINHFEIK